MSYVTSLPCTRDEADFAALLDDPFPGADPLPTLVGNETKTGWELLLYTAEEPDTLLLQQFAALAPTTLAAPEVKSLEDADWLTLSQAGLEPVDIGRFHIHTNEHQGLAKPGQWPIRIDAGLAFGTGQHATTSGCVKAADTLARKHRFTNILDVGTGAGVLAFVANRLWRQARLTAADLDPVAVDVARGNARLNQIVEGRAANQITLLTAPGVEHPLIARRAPYDLVFANILAGPLIALAPSVSSVIARGGFLILAGLLAPQARGVTNAYQAQDMQLVSRGHKEEWPVLVLRKTVPANVKSALRGSRRQAANRGWKIDTI